jgi:hypothetical protein
VELRADTTRAGWYARIGGSGLTRALPLRDITYSGEGVANRCVRGFRAGDDGSRGRYATPADSPLHDGTPYRGLHARRWGLGFVPGSRTVLCRPVPAPRDTIRNFVSSLCHLEHRLVARALHRLLQRLHVHTRSLAGRLLRHLQCNTNDCMGSSRVIKDREIAN